MRTLYPPIKNYYSGFLQVSKLHKIYYEESGNPKGKPVIFLHGGPGSGSKSYHRQFFNPRKYRIVIFDQRGSGRSLPRGELKENTTQNLVSDIEKLRKHLRIKKWMVFGGSWGSTLALSYGEIYPQRVTEMILRGVWTIRKKEMKYFWEMAKLVFPDLWQKMEKSFPEVKNIKNPFSYFYQQINKKNLDIQKKVTAVFSILEQKMSVLQTEENIGNSEELGPKEIAGIKIELHYCANKGFLQEGELLKNSHKLKKIPMIIIHGRYDMLCPLETAYLLHQQLPQSKLFVVPDAGHHWGEPGMLDKLIKATDRFVE